MGTPKSKTRYYIYATALVPFSLLLASGLIMLYYHTGAPRELLLMGIDGYEWLWVHQLLCVISTPFILLHLLVKTDWVKRLFTLQLKARFKKSNVLIFSAFVLCLLTGVSSWLLFDGAEIVEALRGIHNKLGLLLILFFVVHLFNYSKAIAGMTKKVFKKSERA